MTTINVYDKDQVDAKAAAVLPSTSGASEGQVLGLDANLEPAWIDASGEGLSFDTELGTLNYLKITTTSALTLTSISNSRQVSNNTSLYDYFYVSPTEYFKVIRASPSGISSSTGGYKISISTIMSKVASISFVGNNITNLLNGTYRLALRPDWQFLGQYDPIGFLVIEVTTSNGSIISYNVITQMYSYLYLASSLKDFIFYIDGITKIS